MIPNTLSAKDYVTLNETRSCETRDVKRVGLVSAWVVTA